MPAAGTRPLNTSSEQRGCAKVRARPPRSSMRQRSVTKVRKEKKVKTRRPTSAKRKSKKTSARSSMDSATKHSTEEHTCPICQESYSASTVPVVHAPCGHIACASCSMRWQEKKSARTCALCRTPILGIAHSNELEQLIVKASRVEAQESELKTMSAGSSQDKDDSSRVALKKALTALTQGDLNNLPGDYRSHVVRCITERAVRKGDFELLKTCLQHYKARPSTNLFCDIASFWKGDPKPLIELMLASGARLDGHREDRPLLSAVSRGNTKIVGALLELKADPLKPTGHDKETALHIAARCGQYGVARMLLDHGVPADICDGVGRTPLFMAEKGLEMHLDACVVRPCERCEARIQLRGELRFRTQSLRGPTQPRAGSATPENDAESSNSSSEWEDSTDVSDVGEWLEDEEEEGQEDEDEDDASS